MRRSIFLFALIAILGCEGTEKHSEQEFGDLYRKVIEVNRIRDTVLLSYKYRVEQTVIDSIIHYYSLKEPFAKPQGIGGLL